MKNTNNTLIAFLNLLGVKYTQSFSEQYYNEHPHKYNLFGLSKMLADYGIENAAIHISDKENDIMEIQTPFIAHFGGDFVVVNNVESDKVSFMWRGIKVSSPIAKFIEAWTGVVLLAESSKKSIEPDYKEHRRLEQMNLLKKMLLFSVLIIITVMICIHQSFYTDVGILLLLLINLAGMYICWLLLLKQMHIQSQYADKICSLFKQKDCNNVLESKSSKLFGIIGWSEIGFGYFSVNVLLLLFSPTLITIIALINIFTLPFTLWSVWYQYSKAKQWCVLCLIVLVLLWAIFTANLLFGYLQSGTFFLFNSQLLYASLIEFRFSSFIFPLVFTVCCYCIAILGTNLFVPKYNTENTIQWLKQSINSIKADEDVFTTLLKKQPFYEISDCDSIIRFGNLNSKLQLTILSNPYCNPCAVMHKNIEVLLTKANNDISVQYILSSFDENLNSTNKYLIAACLSDNIVSATQIFKDWFEKGKELKDNYFKKLSLNMDNPKIEIEFLKHESWKNKTQIRATPTVLVNGYQLPENYKIEDLQYFIDLDL